MKTTRLIASLSAVLLGIQPASRAASVLEALAEQGLGDRTVAAFRFQESLDPVCVMAGIGAKADFQRSSCAWTPAGVSVPAQMPRFAECAGGRGVWIEEGTENLLPATASGPGMNAGSFTARGAAKLSMSTNHLCVGANCLQVVTAGAAPREGFHVDTRVELRTPAACASLYLHGQGRLRLYVMDATHHVIGSPSFVELAEAWRRFTLPPIVTATNGQAVLRLVVETVEAQAADFQADGLQIEPRAYATSWTPGGAPRSPDLITYRFSGDTPAIKAGTIVLRVMPLSDPRMRLARTFLKCGGRSAPGLFWNIYNTLDMNGVAPHVQGSQLLSGQERWHLFACTWSGTEVSVFHNGRYANGAATVGIDRLESLCIPGEANALFAELVLLNTPLTAGQLDKLWSRVRETAPSKE